MVSLAGQVVCLEVLAGAGSRWHCKYEFVHGADWRCVGGVQAGLSQIANVVQNGEKVVLNLPIQIVFRSTNPYGCEYWVFCFWRQFQCVFALCRATDYPERILRHAASRLWKIARAVAGRCSSATRTSIETDRIKFIRIHWIILRLSAGIGAADHDCHHGWQQSYVVLRFVLSVEI